MERNGSRSRAQADNLACVDQAMDYIRMNLDRRPTVEEIADYCCFSRHYFNRMFRAVTGENINEFTRRLRLERAAYRLLKTGPFSITDIATEAGYSPSNFAVAFRDYFGVSATEYRERTGSDVRKPRDAYAEARERLRLIREAPDEKRLEELDRVITVRRVPAMFLYYRRFVGPYRDLSPAWEEFCEHAQARFPELHDQRFVGVSYDDPLVTDDDRCTYDICVVEKEPLSANCHRIPEADCACYAYDGTLDNLISAYVDLNGLWLPLRDHRQGNGLCLEVYRQGPDERGRVNMEIIIPLAR